MIGLAVTGGHNGTALFWMYPFPIVFFVLLNHKAGLIFNVLLLACIFSIIHIPQLNFVNYDININLRFEVSMIILVTFAYISEYMRESSHRQLITINKEKQRVANTDQLTKIPNRRFLEELTFSSPNEKGEIAEFPMAMVMADIDYFKRVNDTYGHDIGDQVLVFLAQFLKHNIRNSDMVVRLGGEEFLLLFPRANIDTAVMICEKFNRTLQSTPFVYENTTINITLSFGVAIADCPEKMCLARVAADKMLYLAKKNGRARVESTTCGEFV